MQHKYQDLIQLFESTFFNQYQTRLVKGGDEPLYQPANEKCSFHQIIFARGFYASALHELAHWFVAGEKRRLLEDFGYWYTPDGRNDQQQKQFEQVEIKPQAIEWALSVAANKKFNISADNLNGADADTVMFTRMVYQQVESYLVDGFPARVDSERARDTRRSAGSPCRMRAIPSSLSRSAPSPRHLRGLRSGKCRPFRSHRCAPRW